MLYHREIFWPKWLRNRLPKMVAQLTYSVHAFDESRNDKYGAIKLPMFVDFSTAQYIEAKGSLAGIEKVVIRQKHCKLFDICIVIELPTCKVKTVWLNSRNDNHQTLDRTKYTTK